MLGVLRTRVAPMARQTVSRSALVHYKPAVSVAAWRSMSSVTIVVPPIADSISEGTLAELSVAEGGSVQTDDVVAKLDTDKVSVDIRATAGGKVTKWHAQVGDNVKVGAPLLTVEVGAAGSVSASAPAAAAGASSDSSASKPIAPTQVSAAPPSSDESTGKGSPLAASGAQAPTSVHPVDPTASRAHQPLIHFRFGKRDASGAAGAHGAHGATHQHQGNAVQQPAAQDFLQANEAAAAAWDALPDRYKRGGARAIKAAMLDLIELGGAPNYEKKAKKGAAA